jgi:ribosomal protein S27AE
VHPIAPGPQAVHDTERCAWWVEPCEHDVFAQDLCKRHYGRARDLDDVPPKFQVFTGMTSHWLLDVDDTTMTATCLVCGPSVSFARHKKPSGPGRRLCCFSRNADSRQRTTGWSEIDYDLAVIAQGNRCAICGNPPKGRGLHGVLHADHSHAEKRQRQLLCGKCNHMLGMAEDDPQVLIAAANYLAREAGLPRLF